MPQLSYTSNVSALTGRSSSPDMPYANNPDAFGAQTGKALQNAGDAIGQAADVAGQIGASQVDRKRQEDVANAVAQSDYTSVEQSLKDTTPIDEYHSTVLDNYRGFVEDNANKIEDDKTRQAYRLRMLDEEPNVSSRAAQYQATTQTQLSKDNADYSINTLQNKLAQTPDQFASLIDQGNAVIDARPNLPSPVKTAMKQQWLYDGSKRTFEGMIQGAKTPEQLDAISTQLVGKAPNGKEWSENFQPNDYKDMVDKIGTLKRSYQEKVNTDAKAVLEQAESRTKEHASLMPSDELQATQTVIARSNDISTIHRMAQVMRNQNIIRTTQRLPPSEIRAQINAANGNPGLAYPDLPPVVSDAVNTAANTFGVSAGFLGGTVQREYGQYLGKKPPVIDTAFAPQATGQGVDTRNIRSDVLSAATVAGKTIGSPLMLAPGSQGSNINISTAGMSDEQQAKVAGALVDSGFTGVAQFPDHMSVDFRTSVPQDFGDKDGKAWGGWTYLTPAVAAKLKEKGFAAGADNSIIKRTSPVDDASAYDYGKTTQIKDVNGNPTSTAVGIGQFTNGTWLDLVKDPTVSAGMGIDTKGKTDEQLLALRSDPDLSIKAMAAYAKKNQSIMERTLGRPVSDAELHMAHFMGAGGAITFLNGYKNSPDQSAAKLMPAAAAANHPVFYDGDKEKTVEQVYNDITNQFSLAPSQITFADNEMRQKVLDISEKEIQEDPMAHAAKVGSHVIPTDMNDPNFFTETGNTAMAVAHYYNIPVDDMKPFTEDTANTLKSQLGQNDANASLQVMAGIQSMGEIPARAAMKQLDSKDAVFAHAGGLYLDGNQAVAGDIIRGRKRILENPSLKGEMGAQDTDIDAAFATATNGSLSNIDPQHRQAIEDAALAYYVQQQATSGKPYKFSKGDYSDAVQAVLGSTRNLPAVDTINGAATMMPKGIDSGTLHNALQRMNIQDYIRMSDNGMPPRYASGNIVDPSDIGSEVMLQGVGGNKYKMMLDDGSYLITGNMGANGRLEPYIFSPDEKAIREAATRPQPTTPYVKGNIPIYGLEGTITK